MRSDEWQEKQRRYWIAMFFAGLVLIGAAVFLVVSVYYWRKYDSEGMPATGLVVDKRINNRSSVDYHVRYVGAADTLVAVINSTPRRLNVGDKVSIYYLAGNDAEFADVVDSMSEVKTLSIVALIAAVALFTCVKWRSEIFGY